MLNFKTRTKPVDLANIITDAPRLARGPMTVAAAEYLVGNERRGLKHYAPRRPLQKYVRTYKLRRNWIVKNSGAKATASNSTSYGPFVQGERQAWMHVGRWRPMSRVEKDNTKGMIRAASLELNKYLKKRGLTVTER